MNKNKLSRFLLSTTVGILTLSLSKVNADNPAELADIAAADANVQAQKEMHRWAANASFSADPKTSAEEAKRLADALVENQSALAAMNSALGNGGTDALLKRLMPLLSGGIELTAGHFDSFLAQIGDSETLRALGVDDVRDLQSPAAERKVLPAQITKLDDAVYFAEQRQDAGEFEDAAAFYLKARDLTDSTNTTKRTEYAEKALLMYSEHFIHRVAQSTTVSDANVAAAQTLLASVKTLAETTNTVTALLRAASCADELATAIYDLALAKKAARDLLTDTTAISAENVKIAKLYVSLYNANIVTRDMHNKAAAMNSGSAKNTEFAAAANAMRLAIGALADAQATSATAVFNGDVTVSTKLNDDAIAFNTMYVDLANTSGVTAAEGLKTSAASAQILLAKLKATWNARNAFAAGTASYIALDAQYASIQALIQAELDTANSRYTAVSSGEQYLSARDIATVRSVNAEKLYRIVLDKAAVSPIVESNVTDAVNDLKDYVTGSVATVVSVVTDMDTALKATLDEVKAAGIRSARTDCNRTLAAAYALLAQARSTQLIKNTSAAVSTGNRAEWLESYLTYARLANNKVAWEAGVSAVDVILAVSAIATPGSDENAKLAKALALTAKAEALLKRNTVADDALVATVNASNALTAGLLLDAKTAAAEIASSTISQTATKVKAYDNLRKAFGNAINLHNSAAVVQGLRLASEDVETAFATGKVSIADPALNAVQSGNGGFVQGILTALTTGADVAAVKTALGTWLTTAGNGITASALSVGSVIPAGSYVGVALVGGGVARSVGFTTSDLTVTGSSPTAGSYFLPGTLAAHYAAMAADATVAVDGVKLNDLDTVEKLYNHLMSKFASIREASDIYKGYAAAAAAYENARAVKTDWAAAEVAGLSAATAATWATKRDAAGAAYVSAADYEIKRLGLLLSAQGIDVSTSYDALSEVAGLSNARATAYVTDDVLSALQNRAMRLKDAAVTYNMSRAAVGTDALIAANVIQRNAAVHKATNITASQRAATAATEAAPILISDGTVGVNLGAYELALKLVNAAYQGVAGFSANATFGAFAGERLTAITTASRNVMLPWLADLKATLELATTGTDAADHRSNLKDMLQTGSLDGTGSDLADSIFSVGAVFDGAPYTATHSARRDVALSYDMVLKSLVALGTTTTPLETHQGYVADALKANATVAKAIALTQYTTTGTVTTDQLNTVIKQLTQRADLAEAAVAAAYGALRSNTPSNTTKTYKAARAQAITEMTGLIQEGGMDLADVVLKEENVLATADLKAKAAHQLGRLLVAKAAAERIRFDNLGTAEDKANALTWNLEAVNAYKKEITAILSQTESSLMANRNTRLIAAYANLAEAYKQAIANGAAAALVKEQYTATFNQAQIVYRQGNSDLAAQMLEDLTNTAGAAVVYGPILTELAQQYEASGKFLEATKAYKSSVQNNVAIKDVAAAYKAAENAFSSAKLAGHVEACSAAAEAFNVIGGEITFHGRVRAEAYANAAEAYILGGMQEAAAVAYKASAAAWANIGDHMQSGNQNEKAAWAFSRITSLSVDHRIAIIQAVEMAAHQLQIADATKRLEVLVGLAEEQIAKIQSSEDGITTGKLKAAVIAAAGAMYEKALAFQKEGDLTHAEAAEKRIQALLKIVDSNGKEAGILVNVAKLYALQKQYTKAVDTYISAAESFVEGGKLLDAANAYASAADAALLASAGSRIQDDILSPLLDISVRVRAGGANASDPAKFDIHLAVVEVYADLARLTPSEIDKAIAAVVAIEAENPTDKAVLARIAGVKIDLLSQKATTVSDDAAKLALLQQAQTAFDAIKGLTGETTLATVAVKKYVAMAGNSLTQMYEFTRAIHTENGLMYIDALRGVIDTVEAAAAAAYNASASIKMSREVALAASKEAARAMQSYTKGMVHYIYSEPTKARTDDMVYLRGMPDRMTNIVENSVRATILGILKSREIAAAIQSDCMEVLDATNKVSSFVMSLRASPVSRDSNGNGAVASSLKATMATTATVVQGTSGDLATQAAAAHTLAPVERATATDALVATRADAVASAVSTGISTQAALIKQAPATTVSTADFANHIGNIATSMFGDGTNKGIVGDLQKAQGGPTTSASTVLKPRV